MLVEVVLCLLCMVVYLGGVGFVRFWGKMVILTGVSWLMVYQLLWMATLGLQRGIEKADFQIDEFI